MGYDSRMKEGEIWDNEVSKQLQAIGFKIGRYNIENVARGISKTPNYSSLDNPTMLFARYFPDGIASDFKNNLSFLWDAKKADTIEKNAYLNYVNLANNNGVEVVLFIQSKSKPYNVYCVPINMVELENADISVSQYPEHRRHPIDSDGWISPRLATKDTYCQFKQRNSHASGTPNKYFDFKKMEMYKIDIPFEHAILKKCINSAHKVQVQTGCIQGVPNV